ncbi:hypothetical protein ABB37_07219 [Leptomonas pyrrhocoris]|uniref:Uncharacterized protein n=1 Tax=Leptomonas pyrrhocoris TaxID=157538 RepID=A0A0N0DTD4_LEPPY|nr:hypothetical protein ABB37_07219 [Leptomonas pyrrhocoris]KPA77338.1 hypothetical protein ABB37_07219 [Leptomonas pyrrhocoris]|eukprot:XP_015655777.1 hypothetical protein ABB37_07219 [Leptomonas pyrrhocoris]
MASPVEQALTAYTPVPPPPISSSGSRPFQRIAVITAEPYGGGGPRTSPSRSSSSWVSLRESVEELDMPPLSAPQSLSLPMTAPPPTMPRMGEYGGPPFALLSAEVIHATATSPWLSARGQGGRTAQRNTPSVTPSRDRRSVPLLAFSTSPLAPARVGGGGGGGGGTTAAALDRSGTSGSAAVVPSGPLAGERPKRGGRLPFPSSASPPANAANAAATSWLRACTVTDELRTDQQPALPQRTYQTPLALFVDYVPSPPKNDSLVLHPTGFSESGCGVSSSFGLSRTTRSASSADFSATLRTWGCQRSTQLNHSATSSGPISQHTSTPPSSASCDAAATTDADEPPSAPRATFAPVPPPPPPSSDTAAPRGEGGASGSATAWGAQRRLTLSPAALALPNGYPPLDLDASTESVPPHVFHVSPRAPAAAAVTHSTSGPSSAHSRVFRHRRDAVGRSERARQRGNAGRL